MVVDDRVPIEQSCNHTSSHDDDRRMVDSKVVMMYEDDVLDSADAEFPNAENVVPQDQ